MKGDFSQWRFDPRENFTGVLQQQGKVLLDSDWNEHARINTSWQDQAGQDAIGPSVAAVPTAAPAGFKVVAARVVTGSGTPYVEVDLLPGRVWADGILVHQAPADPAAPLDPISRTALYLTPPIQTPAATPPPASPAANGLRDAVVLEVWREAVSGFQIPQRLLEPALGGVDTTERILTSSAIRLLRLLPGEDCFSIHGKLKDNPALFGRITASLTPTTVVAGECPVVQGGGYVGLEHRLYRIEIANTNDGTPRFKWSQWNGGLVGAGVFHTSGTDITIDIEANRTAILTSGLTGFYLEVVTFDAALGHWRASYGVPATLNPNGTIEIDTTQVIFGTPPPDPSADPTDDPRSFFRLWNGIERLSDHLNVATPEELPDELGVHVSFENPAAKVYRPGDYWTFTVRAGDIGSAENLLTNALPAGIEYHRVPLGIVTWSADLDTSDGGEIHDCRRRFRPLSRLDTCCTYRVGDGHTSLGDFDSIQAAIDALPDDGGEVCLLPGEFRERIELINRRNITLSGCGLRTRLLAPEDEQLGPIISILGGERIKIESLAVEASARGRAILALGFNPLSRTAGRSRGRIRDLTFENLDVSASAFAAIRAEWIEGLVVRNCALHMQDVHCEEQALVVLADDALIERNLVEVLGGESGPILRLVAKASGFTPGAHSHGGIHLKSLCERVEVAENQIRGGSNNGITLGSLFWVDDNDDPVPPEDEPPVTEDDPCEPSRPISIGILITVILFGDRRIRQASAGPLYQIKIRCNQISEMGTNGIGVIGFFDLRQADEFITVVDLEIRGNTITECLRREVAVPPDSMAKFMGYGGISLADVENLVIHDNTIVDNGPTHLDPVCGIYVLHVESADIVRNRIVNNGRRVTVRETGGSVKHGQRGGIAISFALPLSVRINAAVGPALHQNGVPAARIHDNIVSTPFGRALTLTALGPVSVVANQFTSQGIPTLSVDITGLLAGTVMILNLGISNELYLQQILFALLNKSSSVDYLTGTATDAASRAGLDDATLGRLLANGQVLFNDNQVNLDLLDRGMSFSASSIFIFTLDDLSFADNQCEANLIDDFLITHMISFAMSQRVTGNRWKEGLLNAPLSALTFSLLMNATSENQGTHCIIVRGLPALRVDRDNKVLFNLFLPSFCEAFSKLLGAFAADSTTAANQSLSGDQTPGMAVANTSPQTSLTFFR